MSSTRELILDKLEESLGKIIIPYGYRTNLAGVKRGDWITKAINQFPYAFIQFSDGYKILEEYVGGSKKISQDIELKFFVTEPITENVEKLYSDLDKLFTKDPNILPEYWHTLSDIPEIKSSPKITQKSKYYDCQANIKVCGCMLNVEFIQFVDCIDGSGYEPIPVPRILDSYALTSETDFLQSEITSISSSLTGSSAGAQWGLITGSISAQYDLGIELNNRYDKNPNISDDNFITVNKGNIEDSGYNQDSFALVDHNHNLNDLTEKDYGSLNNKPNLNSYSLTSHSHSSFTSLTANLLQSDNIILPIGSASNLPLNFRRADGGINNEGFYSIGVGIGVVANSTYSSVFMPSGIETRKLMIDNDMWNNDLTIYEKNGMCFTYGGVDRMELTNNLSLTGNLSVNGNINSNSLTTGNLAITGNVTVNGAGTYSSDLTPTLTGYTNGTVSVTGSADSPSYEVWKLFAKTYRSLWDVTGLSAWVKLDWGIGQTKIITKYTFKADNIYMEYAPKSWTLQGSNDNANWTILDTRTNIVGWTTAEVKTFTFNNFISYRYYKFNMTESNSGNEILFDEITMHDSTTTTYNTFTGTISVGTNFNVVNGLIVT